MRKNILNKTLLSMAAASLLTTSAMATDTEIIIDVTAKGDANLTKDGGKIKLFDLDINITGDLAASRLDEINLTITDNSKLNNATTFLETIDLYHNTIDSSGFVTSASIGKDFNQTKSILLDLSTFSDKVQFAERNNKFYVYLKYSPITQAISHQEFTASVNSIFTTYNIEDNSSQEINSTLNYDTTDKKTYTVDTVAPKWQSLTSSLNSDIDKTLSENQPTSDTVEISFDTALSSIANITDNITNANKHFTATDGKGKVFPLTAITVTDKNVSLTINTKTDGKDLSSGDIYLSYTPGFLKDSFGNIVDANSSIKIFDDNVSAHINTVELSFQDSAQGMITFSERLQDGINWADVNFTANNSGINGGEDHNFTLHSFIQGVTADELNTTLKFEVNATDTHYPRSGFTVSITDNTSSIVRDLGENNSSGKIGKREFTTNSLGFDITANAWNLVSIDSGQLTTSKHIFKTGAVQTIWGYDNNDWVKSPKVLVAGKGYWIRGLNKVDKFKNAETTGYEAVVITDSKSNIKTNSSTEWKLLGTATELDWADVYSQVHSNCGSISVYEYNSSRAAGSEWNGGDYIPANSGLWVKQENCD